MLFIALKNLLYNIQSEQQILRFAQNDIIESDSRRSLAECAMDFSLRFPPNYPPIEEPPKPKENPPVPPNEPPPPPEEPPAPPKEDPPVPSPRPPAQDPPPPDRMALR